MVVTYVVGLYGAAGTAVYCAASAVSNPAFIFGYRSSDSSVEYIGKTLLKQMNKELQKAIVFDRQY